jgi:hypothetical protein
VDGILLIQQGNLTNILIRKEIEESIDFVIGQIIIFNLSESIDDGSDIDAKSWLEN